ncbi:hypothetical protein [Halomarina oriensis]|uniref:DUF1059 domain-containing protein n=1 Tax=Halomarina oriensis TaxID=671145 RepID=A0A6B0GN59_9EURY|nr:hypothetical protein [Halomarina oriensis]MWG36110.1 hypothetical protein [Halomarina oriensis]
MEEPTNDWHLACIECEFRGAASSERLAERLADTHRAVTDHSLAIEPATEESTVA